MGIRSGILAATFGTILTLVLCDWAAIMYWLCLSWLWSVAPLLLAFLIVTWLHAPDWLVERKSWRERLRLALVVAVPALAILVAIPLVRLYEIPLVGPGFDVAELTKPTTPEDKETLVLYNRAMQLQGEAKSKRAQVAAGHVSPSAAEESAWRKLDEQAVALALEASLGRSRGPTRSLEWSLNIDLAELVLADGKRLQSEGKLDAALDRYVAAVRIAITVRRQGWGGLDSTDDLQVSTCEQLVRWAAESGQTPQRGARSPSNHGEAMAKCRLTIATQSNKGIFAASNTSKASMWANAMNMPSCGGFPGSGPAP